MSRSSDLVGTWSLVSFVASGPNGELRHPWGERPSGELIYTANGHMAVVMAQPERAKFASGDPLQGTPEEVRQAFEGMEAYAGTYEVDMHEQCVVHHVAIHRLPNWEGSVQRRHFLLQGDHLTLRTPPFSLRGSDWVLVLVWRRTA